MFDRYLSPFYLSLAYDFLDILFVVLITFVVATIIIGTCSTLLLSTVTSTKHQVIRAFSLPVNINRLFEHRSSPTDFINTIRVISEQIVIIIHIRIIITEIGLENPMKMECDAHQLYTPVLAAFVILIQNFFLLSGFLSFYVNARKIIVSDKFLTKTDFIEMVVWRVVRLGPLMALMIFFNATVGAKLGSGPIWAELLGDERRNCRRNWWTNLLFVNNLYRTNEPVRD